MRVRFSSGLRAALATDWGAGVMMNGGTMLLFDTDMPASPDAPVSVSPLAQVTDGGRIFVPDDDPFDAGLKLQFIPPYSVIGLGEWKLNGRRVGNAKWMRWFWRSGDTQDYSTYYPRVDVDVGTLESTAAMRLASTLITPETSIPINHFMLMMSGGSG